MLVHPVPQNLLVVPRSSFLCVVELRIDGEGGWVGCAVHARSNAFIRPQIDDLINN